jgi:hypothetical protein
MEALHKITTIYTVAFNKFWSIRQSVEQIPVGNKYEEHTMGVILN